MHQSNIELFYYLVFHFILYESIFDISIKFFKQNICLLRWYKIYQVQKYKLLKLFLKAHHITPIEF